MVLAGVPLADPGHRILVAGGENRHAALEVGLLADHGHRILPVVDGSYLDVPEYSLHVELESNHQPEVHNDLLVVVGYLLPAVCVHIDPVFEPAC